MDAKAGGSAIALPGPSRRAKKSVVSGYDGHASTTLATEMPVNAHHQMMRYRDYYMAIFISYPVSTQDTHISPKVDMGCMKIAIS